MFFGKLSIYFVNADGKQFIGEIPNYMLQYSKLCDIITSVKNIP